MPAVSVPAAGEPAVDPIIICPFVEIVVMAGTPLEFVVRTPLLAVDKPATVLVEEE